MFDKQKFLMALVSGMLALATHVAVAQQGNNMGGGPAGDQPQGIEPSGAPMFKFYELTDTSCEAGDMRMAIRLVNLPEDTYIHTVVDAGGLRYMNEQFTFEGMIISHDQNWGLFDNDDGGTFSPRTGTWPIPNNTPLTINFFLRDAFDGAILYQRDVTISQCNGGEVTDNEIVVGGTESGTTRASFIVNKNFADDNPGDVDVSIDCNTGLILDQDKTIENGETIEFVVTNFTNETLNCSITEVPLPGYTGYHYDSDSDFFADEAPESCEYQVVEDGEQGFCLIVNYPDPVEISVTKNWVVTGDDNGVDYGYELDLDCQGGVIFDDDDRRYGEGPDSEVHTFVVTPDYPSTTCAVYEDAYDDALEVDNGCGSLVISAGSGASCTITNTVFYEGIPSLNQYGMAILALLMLGVGVVGFRRFV